MSYFNTQKDLDDNFWKLKSNQGLLKQILRCDEVIINDRITESDYHLGVDAVGKKKMQKNGLTFDVNHSISLRIRFDNRFLDLNFRNYIANDKSELSKILARYNSDSNYAKYFVQFFDVENNKAKFCVLWRTDDIAVFTYDKLDSLDTYFKTSTSRYDFPLKEAIHYNAVCYDLSNDEVNKVNYQYIKNTFRS